MRTTLASIGVAVQQESLPVPARFAVAGTTPAGEATGTRPWRG